LFFIPATVFLPASGTLRAHRKANMLAPGGKLLPAAGLLLRSLLLRRLLLAADLPQLGQFTIQAMPQRTLGAKFFQEGLGPGEDLFIDLLIAKKSSPCPLDFMFGKQSITS
jgi:hypothetical protein